VSSVPLPITTAIITTIIIDRQERPRPARQLARDIHLRVVTGRYLALLGRSRRSKIWDSSGLLRHQSNDLERPNPAIQVRCRERLLSDRKADIAYEEIIVRRSNRLISAGFQGSG
jgi:hypothetical protein